MKKILLPIDGSDRSLRSAEQLTKLFSKEDVEVVLLTVRSSSEFIKDQEQLAKAKTEAFAQFNAAKAILDGYQLQEQLRFGHVGDAILKYIEDENIAAVIMTRSTREGSFKNFGSVTSHVLKYARCLVIVVPEIEHLVYIEHNATVDLQGQFSRGADSCLLPVEAGKCFYEISVQKGKVRFIHSAFNYDGGSWTLTIGDMQKSNYYIEAGETKHIEIFVGISFGHEDRVELVNASFREPAAVTYRYWRE